MSTDERDQRIFVGIRAAIVSILDAGQVSRHEQKQLAMDDCVNVLALVKDGERFVFLYDDSSRSELLRTLGRYAADPELSFSWYDAAVLSQRVRRMETDAEDDQSTFRRSA